MPSIIILAPDTTRTEHALADKPVVIGRGDTADIQLSDPKSSRRHIELSPVDNTGAWRVRDLGSRNGVQVNGVSIENIQTLAEGDVIRIGKTLIAFALLPDDFVIPDDIRDAHRRAREDGGPAATNRSDTDEPVAKSDDVIIENADPVLPDTQPIERNSEPVAVTALRLISLSGTFPDFPLVLTGKPVRIGRKPDNEIVISDEEKKVSSYHAEIHQEDGKLFLVDLKSTNGTYVKAPDESHKKKIDRVELVSGMVVAFGRHLFRFENASSPESPASPVALKNVFTDDDKPTVRELSPDAGRESLSEPPSGSVPSPETQTGLVGKPVGRKFAILLSGVSLIGLIVILIIVISVGSRPDEPAGDESGDMADIVAKPKNTDRLLSDGFEKQDDRGYPPGWHPQFVGPSAGMRIIQKKNGVGNKIIAIDKNGAHSLFTQGILRSGWKTVQPDTSLRAGVDAMTDDQADGVMGIRVTFRGAGRELSVPRVRMGVCPDWTKLSVTAVAPAWAEKVRLELFAVGEQGVAMFDNVTLRRVDTPSKLPAVLVAGKLSLEYLSLVGVMLVQGPQRASIPMMQMTLVDPERRRIVADHRTTMTASATDLSDAEMGGIVAVSQSLWSEYTIKTGCFQGELVVSVESTAGQTGQYVPAYVLELGHDYSNGRRFIIQSDGRPVRFRRRKVRGAFRFVAMDWKNDAIRILVNAAPSASAYLINGKKGKKLLVMEVHGELTLRIEQMDEQAILQANLPLVSNAAAPDAITPVLRPEVVDHSGGATPAQNAKDEITPSDTTPPPPKTDPPATRPTPSKAANTPATDIRVTPEQEAAADELLRKAKTMIRIRQYPIARAHLRNILDSYPDTEAAKQASALIDNVNAHVDARKKEKLILNAVRDLERNKNYQNCIDYVKNHPDWAKYGASFMPELSRKLEEWRVKVRTH